MPTHSEPPITMSVAPPTMNLMGFTRRQYEEYIASPAWAGKCERALKKHGRHCKACGATGPGLHVHHHTYERFGREHIDDLMILCKPCHQTLHRMHDRQRFSKGISLTMTEVSFAFVKKANPTAYSAAVMADHIPVVAPAPKRTDGKRVVSLAKADRPRVTGRRTGQTRDLIKLRAERYRELKKRLG